MVMAQLYPEPGKGGRGVKGPKNWAGFGAEYLRMARTVYHHARGGGKSAAPDFWISARHPHARAGGGRTVSHCLTVVESPPRARGRRDGKTGTMVPIFVTPTRARAADL